MGVAGNVPSHRDSEKSNALRSVCSPHSDGISSKKDDIVVRIYVRVAFYRG